MGTDIEKAYAKKLLADEKLMNEVIQKVLEDPDVTREIAEEVADELADELEDD